MRLLGIDVGGTFTDFVEATSDGIRTWKRLSTPQAPDVGVLEGVPDDSYDRVVHGSTVATNALLERKGPRTVLIVTEGFKDLLQIRRQTRPRLYELEPRRTPHVVRRGDAIQVQERMDYEGNPIIALEDAEVERVAQEAANSGATAFAICLIHSYANPEHETRLAEALRKRGLSVCASFEVLPEYREYERGSTTAINAFLQPTVAAYVSRLESHLEGMRIMHSAAGLSAASEAAARPVSMILSGPAGGVLGARAVASLSGIDRIITFDMGGTSTDVALCDGGAVLRNAMEVDGLAVNTPLVDIETVGAGGGSIARIDEGGALVVGPESAGADPGPACYGKGTLPTVSDANLVLGRLWEKQPLGGTLLPDVRRATEAVGRLGPAEETARAIIQVANTNMARAIRRVSLERGRDPADFTLVAFGGAGPLHACELADEVGIPRVLIPRVPGVLSALGMLTAPEALERSHAVLATLDENADKTLGHAAERLERDARDAFADEGFDVATLSWSGDARYRGQAHELRVTVDSPTTAGFQDAFQQAHQQRYGYGAESRPVELVTLRARVEGDPPAVPMEPGEDEHGGEMVIGESAAGRVVARAAIPRGGTVEGPCVIVQEDATAYVPEGWRGEADAHMNLVLEPAP